MPNVGGAKIGPLGLGNAVGLKGYGLSFLVVLNVADCRELFLAWSIGVPAVFGLAINSFYQLLIIFLILPSTAQFVLHLSYV
jgi:hypothetical protein